MARDTEVASEAGATARDTEVASEAGATGGTSATVFPLAPTGRTNRRNGISDSVGDYSRQEEDT